MTNKIPKEYELNISTNDVKSAVAKAASHLYDWLDFVLLDAEEAEDEESDFIVFARDIQTALGRHPLELSYGSEAEPESENEDASAFE
jgi:hypothetical protein